MFAVAAINGQSRAYFDCVRIIQIQVTGSWRAHTIKFMANQCMRNTLLLVEPCEQGIVRVRSLTLHRLSDGGVTSRAHTAQKVS